MGNETLMTYAEFMQAAARKFITDLLLRNAWNVTKAAAEADLTRPNFYRHLRRLKIKIPAGTPTSQANMIPGRFIDDRG